MSMKCIVSNCTRNVEKTTSYCDLHQLDNPNTPEDELRKELRAVHNRFHGRFRTHAEVAKHSHWTTQELENVQIEDEELMYDEIIKLSADRTNLITQLEAKKAHYSIDVDEESDEKFYTNIGIHAGIDTAIEVLRGEV